MGQMMNLDASFWKNKKVFLTGHTGFKGGWLTLWLESMGAIVYGFSREPVASPNLFEIAQIEKLCSTSEIGDITNIATLRAALEKFNPEIVIHMAAQSLVRYSYIDPVETYATNVMGTVNLLEVIRDVNSVRVVIVVTSDKCYENLERSEGYKESDAMGGFDPYSSSKGCAELVASAYRRSYFTGCSSLGHKAYIATCRAGNVIGGGDWASDRLVPDAISAFESKIPVKIRNPNAIRPWQHVLEPLSGYLLLAQALYERGEEFSGAWNFGPAEADAQSVSAVVELMGHLWGRSASWEVDGHDHPHEANFLRLDCSKSNHKLGWRPKWTLEKALSAVIDWHEAYKKHDDVSEFMKTQIKAYLRA